MAINIPNKVFDDFNEAVLLMEKQLKLFYPERKTECPNCYLDTMGTRNRSISIYKTGGPYPFETGMPCPHCDGKGYLESTVTETIPSRIYINPKEWSRSLKIAIPDGAIMTICRMDYATKIRQCKYVQPLYNGLDGHFTDNYYRVGDIYSESFNLNPIKYVTAIWGKNGQD
jgi:hypothetical protein